MRCAYLAVAATLILALAGTAGATPAVVGNSIVDGFETSWTGSYAPGWDNVVYRWGNASASVMTQQTTRVHSGSYGMALSVDAAGSPVGSTNWWGSVIPVAVPGGVLQKQYNPSVSVWYYDEIGPPGALPGGYLAAVPDTGIPDDWTDIQHGTRWNKDANYWYGWGTASGFVYNESTIARTEGWHEFKLSLSSAGVLDYYIDGTNVGSSTRTDYNDLGGIGLGVWLMDGDFPDSTVYFDDFQVTSSAIPEPVTMAGLLLGVGCMVRYVRSRKA